MNLIDYVRLWLRTRERPPREVFLVGTRKSTQAEIEYGKTLELFAHSLHKRWREAEKRAKGKHTDLCIGGDMGPCNCGAIERELERF